MGRQVPAVARALDILELLFEDGELSIPEIQQRLGLPRTSVHELVNTLVERAYLAPVATGERRYQLGVSVLHLGSTYAARIDLVRDGQLVAAEVAARCDETTHVAVLDGRDVVYIAKVDSTKPVRMVSAVGRRLPAHCTGVGKALLAALDEAELDRRYSDDAPLTGLTAKSITDPARLREELEEVRRIGLAYDDCESNEAVRCIAAPIRDHAGETVAAMSISAPTMRWDGPWREEFAQFVLDGVDDLSRRLGWRPSSTT